MRQHTQGLLQINRTVACPYLVTEERAVAQVLFHIGSEDPEVQGNADRLLAAWNACDGIPTDCLQPGAVKSLADAVRHAVTSMSKLSFGDFSDEAAKAIAYSSFEGLRSALALVEATTPAGGCTPMTANRAETNGGGDVADKANDELTPADVHAMSVTEFEERFGFKPADKLEKYMYGVTGNRLTPTVRMGIELGIVGDPPDLSRVAW